MESPIVCDVEYYAHNQPQTLISLYPFQTPPCGFVSEFSKIFEISPLYRPYYQQQPNNNANISNVNHINTYNNANTVNFAPNCQNGLFLPVSNEPNSASKVENTNIIDPSHQQLVDGAICLARLPSSLYPCENKFISQNSQNNSTQSPSNTPTTHPQTPQNITQTPQSHSPLPVSIELPIICLFPEFTHPNSMLYVAHTGIQLNTENTTTEFNHSNSPIETTEANGFINHSNQAALDQNDNNNTIFSQQHHLHDTSTSHPTSQTTNPTSSAPSSPQPHQPPQPPQPHPTQTSVPTQSNGLLDSAPLKSLRIKIKGIKPYRNKHSKATLSQCTAIHRQYLIHTDYLTIRSYRYHYLHMFGLPYDIMRQYYLEMVNKYCAVAKLALFIHKNPVYDQNIAQFMGIKQYEMLYEMFSTTYAQQYFNAVYNGFVDFEPILAMDQNKKILANCGRKNGEQIEQIGGILGKCDGVIGMYKDDGQSGQFVHNVTYPVELEGGFDQNEKNVIKNNENDQNNSQNNEQNFTSLNRSPSSSSSSSSSSSTSSHLPLKAPSPKNDSIITHSQTTLFNAKNVNSFATKITKSNIERDNVDHKNYQIGSIHDPEIEPLLSAIPVLIEKLNFLKNGNNINDYRLLNNSLYDAIFDIFHFSIPLHSPQTIQLFYKKLLTFLPYLDQNFNFLDDFMTSNKDELYQELTYLNNVSYFFAHTEFHRVYDVLIEFYLTIIKSDQNCNFFGDFSEKNDDKNEFQNLQKKFKTCHDGPCGDYLYHFENVYDVACAEEDNQIDNNSNNNDKSSPKKPLMICSQCLILTITQHLQEATITNTPVYSQNSSTGIITTYYHGNNHQNNNNNNNNNNNLPLESPNFTQTPTPVPLTTPTPPHCLDELNVTIYSALASRMAALYTNELAQRLCHYQDYIIQYDYSTKYAYQYQCVSYYLRNHEEMVLQTQKERDFEQKELIEKYLQNINEKVQKSRKKHNRKGNVANFVKRRMTLSLLKEQCIIIDTVRKAFGGYFNMVKSRANNVINFEQKNENCNFIASQMPNLTTQWLIGDVFDEKGNICPPHAMYGNIPVDSVLFDMLNALGDENNEDCGENNDENGGDKNNEKSLTNYALGLSPAQYHTYDSHGLRSQLPNFQEAKLYDANVIIYIDTSLPQFDFLYTSSSNLPTNPPTKQQIKENLNLLGKYKKNISKKKDKKDKNNKNLFNSSPYCPKVIQSTQLLYDSMNNNHVDNVFFRNCDLFIYTDPTNLVISTTQECITLQRQTIDTLRSAIKVLIEQYDKESGSLEVGKGDFDGTGIGNECHNEVLPNYYTWNSLVNTENMLTIENNNGGIPLSHIFNPKLNNNNNNNTFVQNPIEQNNPKKNSSNISPNSKRTNRVDSQPHSLSPTSLVQLDPLILPHKTMNKKSNNINNNTKITISPNKNDQNLSHSQNSSRTNSPLNLTKTLAINLLNQSANDSPCYPPLTQLNASFTTQLPLKRAISPLKNTEFGPFNTEIDIHPRSNPYNQTGNYINYVYNAELLNGNGNYGLVQNNGQNLAQNFAENKNNLNLINKKFLTELHNNHIIQHYSHQPLLQSQNHQLSNKGYHTMTNNTQNVHFFNQNNNPQNNPPLDSTHQIHPIPSQLSFQTQPYQSQINTLSSTPSSMINNPYTPIQTGLQPNNHNFKNNSNFSNNSKNSSNFPITTLPSFPHAQNQPYGIKSGQYNYSNQNPTPTYPPFIQLPHPSPPSILQPTTSTHNQRIALPQSTTKSQLLLPGIGLNSGNGNVAQHGGSILGFGNIQGNGTAQGNGIIQGHGTVHGVANGNVQGPAGNILNSIKNGGGVNGVNVAWGGSTMLINTIGNGIQTGSSVGNNGNNVVINNINNLFNNNNNNNQKINFHQNLNNLNNFFPQSSNAVFNINISTNQINPSTMTSSRPQSGLYNNNHNNNNNHNYQQKMQKIDQNFSFQNKNLTQNTNFVNQNLNQNFNYNDNCISSSCSYPLQQQQQQQQQSTVLLSNANQNFNTIHGIVLPQ
jgi:hypothetical protein